VLGISFTNSQLPVKPIQALKPQRDIYESGTQVGRSRQPLGNYSDKLNGVSSALLGAGTYFRNISQLAEVRSLDGSGLWYATPIQAAMARFFLKMRKLLQQRSDDFGGKVGAAL
jgi:hypothetical protein